VALEATEMALPSHKARILADMQAIIASHVPVTGGTTTTTAKVRRWKPGSKLSGRKLTNTTEVEQAVQELKQELADLVEGGFTVIIE
jgi:hypothetical protein